MKRKKLAIATDSMCGLPASLFEMYDIRVIYGHIYTDKGEFYDVIEVTASNMLEYMESHTELSHTDSPAVGEAAAFFERELAHYEELLFISTSSRLSNTYHNIMAAADGNPAIHVIDSLQISGGLGILVLTAAYMLQEGKSCAEITEQILLLRPRIYTVLSMNTVRFMLQYHYWNAKLLKLFSYFSFHPCFRSHGDKIRFHGIYFGSVRKYCLRVVRRELFFQRNRICPDILLIASSGCQHTLIDAIKREALQILPFQMVFHVPFAATITSHCGPDSFAIFYVEKSRKNKKADCTRKE